MKENMEAQLMELVGSILEDYNEDKYIDKENTFDAPDKKVIIDIIDKMQQIVFPGHFRNKLFRTYTVQNKLTMLLEDVMFNLNRQILRVLKYDPNFAHIEGDDLEARVNETCLEFLRRIPKIREYIETDVQAAFDGDPAAYNKDEIIYSYPGMYAIFVNRIAHELYLMDVPLIPRMMAEYAHGVTGTDIHPGATIGKYFFIDHATGIVIGETTEIGEHVKVYQGVTLGALSTKDGQSLRNVKRHPTVEDNVTIYSGASILGGNTVIGKNAVIGGNAFITQSIPPGTRVSIKNQELIYKYDANHPVQKVELEQDDDWN